MVYLVIMKIICKMLFFKSLIIVFMFRNFYFSYYFLVYFVKWKKRIDIVVLNMSSEIWLRFRLFFL